MLLFEEEKKDESPPKPEVTTVAAYLDEEHGKMLAFIQASGTLNKSEAIRQCIRLGYRTLKDRKSASKVGAA